MFRHVVMFRWNDTVDDAHVAALATGLDHLAAEIDEIVDYRHGPDAALNEGTYDYVVVGDFNSRDDYVIYRDHPAHLAFIADLVAGRVTERAAVQYDIG